MVVLVSGLKLRSVWPHCLLSTVRKPGFTERAEMECCLVSEAGVENSWSDHEKFVSRNPYAPGVRRAFCIGLRGWKWLSLKVILENKGVPQLKKDLLMDFELSVSSDGPWLWNRNTDPSLLAFVNLRTASFVLEAEWWGDLRPCDVKTWLKKLGMIRKGK